MIYRHSLQQIQKYHETMALNQSGIKLLIEKGVDDFLESWPNIGEDEFGEEPGYFKIGKAVDIKLTGEEGDFDKLFYVANYTPPSDVIMRIINMVYAVVRNKIEEDKQVYSDLDYTIEENLAEYQLEIYNACNTVVAEDGKIGYFMNRKIPKDDRDIREWTEDKRWEAVVKTGQEFWESKIKAMGKQTLSRQEGETVEKIYQSFTTHKHTAGLLKHGQRVDIVFQLPIYFTYLDVPCKALIDEVRIVHSPNGINGDIYGIDFKTLGDYVTRFKHAAKKRRYDIQGSFYKQGLKHALVAISNIIGKDVTGYEIKPFAFLTESTKKPGVPLVYIMDSAIEEFGARGDKYGRFLGWQHGIDLFNKWREAGFSLEKFVDNSNGMVWLQDDFDTNIKF